MLSGFFQDVVVLSGCGQDVLKTFSLNSPPQSLFFLLVLVENVALGLVPIVLHGGDHCCIPLEKLNYAFAGLD